MVQVQHQVLHVIIPVIHMGPTVASAILEAKMLYQKQQKIPKK